MLGHGNNKFIGRPDKHRPERSVAVRLSKSPERESSTNGIGNKTVRSALNLTSTRYRCMDTVTFGCLQCEELQSPATIHLFSAGAGLRGRWHLPRRRYSTEAAFLTLRPMGGYFVCQSRTIKNIQLKKLKKIETKIKIFFYLPLRSFSYEFFWIDISKEKIGMGPSPIGPPIQPPLIVVPLNRQYRQAVYCLAYTT